MWAQLIQPVPLGGGLHPFNLGNCIWVKVRKRKDNLSPLWEEPFLVLLTFLNSKGGRKKLTLIHHSHLKAATGLELEPGNPPATEGTSTTAESDSPAAGTHTELVDWPWTR